MSGNQLFKNLECLVKNTDIDDSQARVDANLINLS